MGRFFNCLNNGNRNYNTFCSSDDNVIYQQIGLPLMYFSAHSRYFDPAAIYLWSAKRRFQGRYRKHGSLDVGIRPEESERYGGTGDAGGSAVFVKIGNKECADNRVGGSD